jgi:hypothetical protein
VIHLIDRRLIEHFDWMLVILVTSLMIIGVVNLYSTTMGQEIQGMPVYLRQTVWFILGFVVMLVVAFIEDPEVIKKILKHLGLWLVKRKPQPRANAPPGHTHLDYSDSQIPPSEDRLYQEPEYHVDGYIF